MVDRPRQSVPSDPNAEDDHADLLATLAAARELGPDMDKALAESYTQRRKANTPVRPRNAEPRPPVNFGFVARGVLPVLSFVAIAALVTLFILSGGHFWFWFLLFPLFWGGWWRRGWGHGRGWYGYDRAERDNRRREYRDARRGERDERRQARRDDRYDWS